MPFKSISRHQPSQREPKLSWPSLTGKSLKVCRYHQNKTPQRSLLPKQQQSSNPRQQQWKASAAGYRVTFPSSCQVQGSVIQTVHTEQDAPPIGQMHFMALQIHGTAHTHTQREMTQKTCKQQDISEIWEQEKTKNITPAMTTKAVQKSLAEKRLLLGWKVCSKLTELCSRKAPFPAEIL